MTRTIRTIILSLAVSFVGLSAHAADFDFSGTFTSDNDVLMFQFTVGSTSDFTIFSSSWLDGDSGLGFDPILAIWDSNGINIFEQDDGGVEGSTMSNGVLYDHGVWDTYFTTTLAAGNYTATVAQFDNFANSTLLSDGFQHDGNPNFTFDLGYGTQDLFNGVWSGTDARTGDWAFHILNIDTAVVPLPAALPSLIFALMSLGFLRRRSQ